MKDQQIVDWIREGKHQKAFSRLYKSFPAIRKMVREHNGTKEDAEDIFQEALILFSRKCEEASFVLNANASTYLFSVSRYLWNDELKRRKRSQIQYEETENFSWEELIQREEQFKQAENVLTKIGEKCLQLLKLFYLDGKSMKQIASKMELSSEKIAKNQKYKCLERAKLNYRSSLTTNINKSELL